LPPGAGEAASGNGAGGRASPPGIAGAAPAAGAGGGAGPALRPVPPPLPPGLYIVPTPLGNLGDLSRRAEGILRSASLAASEDTRRTVKLLNCLGIGLSQLSYREQNHASAWPRIREALARGRAVALLTDAGSPAVSDPGAALVRAAREAGFAVYPLPGPSAVTTALSASGFPAGSFTFCGFPPARSAARRRFLSGYRGLRHPLVLFEAPHRLAESLADLLEILGPRRAFVAREMTKLHEEFLAGRLDELLAEATERPRKGEITLVVEGAPRLRAGLGGGEGYFAGQGDLDGQGDSGGQGGYEVTGEPGGVWGSEQAAPERKGGAPGEAPGGHAGDPRCGPREGGPHPPPAQGDTAPPPPGRTAGGDGWAGRGPLCSPRSLEALKTLFEAARADPRPLPESARELSALTGVPRKALYALLSSFRSQGD
jgi:16S rRNA (cytidine1402-2'-O)-methyltransferase